MCAHDIICCWRQTLQAICVHDGILPGSIYFLVPLLVYYRREIPLWRDLFQLARLQLRTSDSNSSKLAATFPTERKRR